MEGKCKRIETPLPEAMIHHIQPFLTAKEAAGTTLLSKSWHNAWLTRPALAFDQNDFKRSSPTEFSIFAVKTIQRYQRSNLKIDSLSLQMQSCSTSILNIAHKLIVDAVKMGATDLNLEFRPCTFALPPEVLRSETLRRLSVSGCKVNGSLHSSILKSLSLDSVLLESDVTLRNTISNCDSIEELSLSSNFKPRKLALSGKNVHELHKLKRLHLENVDVDNSFFDDFEGMWKSTTTGMALSSTARCTKRSA